MAGFSTLAVSADDRGSIFFYFFPKMSCDFRGLLLEGVGRESGGNDGGGLCVFAFSRSVISL